MMKMIPFTAERTYETVFQMALRWLKDDENKYSPEKRVLIELYKQLQQKQHSNFYEKGDEYLPHQFWGMRKSGSFFILDSVFEDWCRRHNVKSFKVAKLLVDAGYLAKEGAGHYKKRITIDGNKYSMFQLSENFLEADVDKL